METAEQWVGLGVTVAAIVCFVSGAAIAWRADQRLRRLLQEQDEVRAENDQAWSDLLDGASHTAHRRRFNGRAIGRNPPPPGPRPKYDPANVERVLVPPPTDAGK